MNYFVFLLIAHWLLLWDFVGAIQFPVEGYRKLRPRLTLRQRATSGTSLNNSGDLSYFTNVTLGGDPFKVLVDTGSSDLWIAGLIADSKDTGHIGGVSYAVGSVEGNIKTANLEFAGFQIPDQAFLEIAPNPQNKVGTGIIGLGPNAGSFIYQELQSEAGTAVLDRIFVQNLTAPNYFTILLGRDKDPTDFFSGSISIREVIDGHTQILHEPKLPMTNVPHQQSGDQHAQVLLDQNGIIGPDGENIRLHSAVEDSPTAQPTVVLDCGFSLPQVPLYVADAIYSRYRGAEFVDVNGVGNVWILPCSQEVNITFVFGGKPYPLHPLDMTMDPKAVGIRKITNSEGTPSCIGTFQPFTYERGPTTNYDMVLGMSFMRNVYVLFDYGDFVAGSQIKSEPYIQMLSITDPVEAHADFVRVRLNGVDTTGEAGLLDANTHHNRHRSPTIYYIAVATSVVGVLLIVAGVLLYRARTKYQT